MPFHRPLILIPHPTDSTNSIVTVLGVEKHITKASNNYDVDEQRGGSCFWSSRGGGEMADSRGDEGWRYQLCVTHSWLLRHQIEGNLQPSHNFLLSPPYRIQGDFREHLIRIVDIQLPSVTCVDYEILDCLHQLFYKQVDFLRSNKEMTLALVAGSYPIYQGKYISLRSAPPKKVVKCKM